MVFLIAVLVIIVILIVYDTIKSRRRHQEIIERKQKYVDSLGPKVRIIVNNPPFLFFKDDSKQYFGYDESGRTYSYSGLRSVSKYKDSITFIHEDAESCMICIGKDVTQSKPTIPLDQASINAIYTEMMPILRMNLQKILDEYGVVPTHEYEIDGDIWGCDIQSKQFYCVCGATWVYKFSDLQRVTVDDLRNNSLYDGSYIIHVYVKDSESGSWENQEYEIHIKNEDSTFHNLLSMFKGIKNRQ